VERPPELLVDEPLWPVERSDATRKSPWHPEVPPTPGNLVTKAQEVGVNAADCPLTRSRHRSNMRGHRERQIEGLGRRHGKLRHALKPNRHGAIITRFVRCPWGCTNGAEAQGSSWGSPAAPRRDRSGANRISRVASYRDELALETGLLQHVFSPIHDSVSPFETVARVLRAGFPGFTFHCILSRKQGPQLTRPLASLWI